MSNSKIVSNLFNTLKYKGKSLFALLVLSVLFCSKINAQSVYFLAQEDFPNYEVHTGWPGTQTITGTTGTWTATVDQTYGDIDVLNYTYQYSSPNAIRMQNNKGASTSTASITSPAINLSAYTCSGKVDLRFGIYTGKLTSSACSYYKVEYSNNGGSTWATAYQQTSAQLLSSVSNPSGWNDITLLIGSSYLVSNFKYRITGVQSAGCGLNNEIWIDDAQIIALACRTSWTNICADNKDVDLYTKSMTNSCANGSLGWTNIGTTEGLNMTNATQVKLYVSTSEQGNPSRTVTVRSKNASGAVVQTQTLSAPTSNQEDPSPINIYEFTFTSLSGVTSFEATASGGCSLTNTSSSVVANGLALAVFRSSVTGYYNTGELVYWGAPGNGIWNYAKSFTLPVTAYTKTALVELTISGLYNNGKGARIHLDAPGGTITTDVFNTDPTGGRLMKVFIPYNNIAGGDNWITVRTDDTYPQNGVYSIDAVKVSVSCTQPLNLGNIVFNDANNNGIKDGAEVGIAGVTVNLYQDANTDNVPDGKILFSTVTDASGNYNFTGLTAGNYIVGVIIPNGYTSAITTGTSSNPNNDTDNDNNGVNLVNSGTELRTNYITLSAAGEPTTDGDGNYGNLTLDLGLKTNTCVKTTETFPNTFNTGFTAPINSTFTGSTGTWAAYSTNSYSTVLCTTPYYLPSTSQAIKLLASATNGGNTDTWCAATSPIIDASGNCCPMQTKLNFTLWTYEMNVNDPWSNFSVDMSGDGGTTWTTNYTITAEAMYNLYGTYGKVNLSIPIPTNLQTSNFRYRFSLYNSWNTSYNFYLFVDDVTISSPVTCGTGSIGNYVWNDLNYNGTQDIGEVGISGATVTLLDNNGSIIASTTTNASGNYTFSNLPAGTYQVAFTTPSGYTATLANQGADDNLDSDPMSSTQSYDPLTARVKNITLTSGQNRTDIDAGFFSTCSAIFTETLPNTFNTGYTTPTNGTFVGNLGTWTVASSSGYAGAVVESNGSTNLLKTINYYDASGTLSTVTITSPTGDIVTPNGACTAVAYLNFDMYPNYINTPPGSNAYKVYIDFSGNGGSTWTNVWAMNGAQILDAYGLNSTYNITIPIASAYYTTTFKFRLRAEQQSGAYCDNYILYDNFKIGKCPCPSLNLGNTVWIDTNGNGVKDGAEVGYSGATVKLYADNNGDNTPDGAAIATTTTNASGVYAFSNLLPGAYIVGVTLPVGYASTVSVATTANPNNDTDNDNNGVTTVSGELRSNYITLSVGGEPASGVDGDGTNGNLTLDFGIVSQSMSVSTATTVCAPTNSNTYTLNGQVTFSSAPSTGTLTVSVQGGHSVVFSAPFTSPLSYTLDGLIADGASRSVTATFSATSASASATYTAPSAIGSGFYNFPLNTFISDFFWGMSPYPQVGWNNVYVPGFGGPYDVGGGVHDLDLSPAGVTNMAAFCAEMAEASESNYHIINKYKIAPLENINRGRAGESGTESANIPSGGIGRVRAGMIRYLFDNYYTSTDANAWTASNAGAFQLAVWELLHEKYTSNNSFTITSASTNGFYVLATYNTASVTQAQGYLNAINTLNWTDAQWMSYKSTAWHVIALEANNDTNPGTPDGQDFLIAQPIVGACVLNLGNVVWFDPNANGIKDAGEPTISGVTVNLYADANTDNVPDGVALATTITNASGVYSFNNLPAGNYIVGVTLPSGYVNSFTPSSGSTTNSDVDNDNNGLTTVGSEVRSNYVTLSIGGEPLSGVDGDGANGNLTMDFGLKGSLQLGNIVWVDLNNNGLRDGSEIGLSGVTVNLYQDANGDNLQDGAAIATTTTGSNGGYNFANLVPGNYIVGAVLPANYTIATTVATSSNPNNDTDDDNNGVTSASGEIRTNYITLTTGGEPTGGTYNSTLDIALKPAQYIGDYVWIDINRNGVQDAPSTGEFGVPGVKVELFNSSNVLLQTTYTDFNGYYGFTVATGSYYVKFSGFPTGLTLTTQGGGTTSTDSDPNPATGITSTFTITSGQVNTTIDAGLKFTAAVGNFVWADTNGNGQQDGGEVGIPGVFVGLYNTSDVLVGGAITDNTGYYLINTVPGTYYLKINVPSGYNLTTQAAGGVPANLNSDANVTTFKTNNITLTTTIDNDQDFGLVLKPNTVVSCGQVPLQVTEVSSSITLNKFVPATYGTLTNVAVDYNALTVHPFIGIENTATGAQTYTLTTTSNATLTLPNASTLVVSNGFATGSTAIGTYDGITDYQGTSGWNQTNLSHANSATSNPYTPTSDFLWTSGGTTISLPFVTSNNAVLSMTGGNNSFQIRTMATAGACVSYTYAALNLGNTVWFDVNNNGIKDAAETGVSGATVKIYADANADNTPDGAALNTTTTNASGVYNFSNLPAGNYIVGVTLPTGYVATTTTVNSTNPNSDTDNDNNGVTTVSGELRSNYITLSIGGEPASGVDGDGTNGNLTLDFGLIGSLNLGNLIWNDTNGNGVKDAFESGINGLTVYLYQDANGDNTPDGTAITTTTTSGGGFYGFSNLPAGNYIVGYTLPTGYANTFKPANNANPNSDTNNDNNGVTRIGNEIRSNYITLSVGGEPASGVDGDGTNGNWTLDFGCAKDTDGDLIPDVIDIDDDNDGITDVKESGGYDPLADCDADGVPNYLDSTPGCTTPSGNDAWGNPFTPLTWTDCNSDGINDFFDKDRDGIINELDLDSDNDGILDVQEARPAGVAVGSTLNGQITGTDADADGLLSSQDINAGNPYNDGIAAQDLDRDGIPNFLDLDSDGDGINDLTEALNSYDADGILTSADSDGDGVRAESFGSSASNIADNINGLGAKGISLLDTDGDGKPNAYDIDSDADGITDNAEGQATCSYILPTGTDCDKDGVDDAYEAGGSCACAGRSTAGVTPYDKDGDSTPDYLDSDTDGDGITDIYEGHTVKTANYWTGSTGDADGDGLIDYFDTFNMSSAVSNFFRNVVNKNMGTNGSWYEGTGGVGSASQLPESDGKDCSTGGDRDWRNVTILPTTLTSFTASLNNFKVANIKWTVTNEINMNSYTVERSVDGVTFKIIATRTAINPSSVSTSINYTADDDLSSITNSVVYYRIKMTDKNNTSKYSNVISFKLYDKVIVGIMVNPNPATTHFTLKVTSVKEEKIQVRIVDNLGKIMSMQSTTITSGVNSILFNDLTKFASGLYSVQVVMNGEVYTDKLIIAK